MTLPRFFVQTLGLALTALPVVFCAQATASEAGQPLQLLNEELCLALGSEMNQHGSQELLLADCDDDAVLRFERNDLGYLQTGERCLDPQDKLWLHDCSEHSGKVWTMSEGRLFGPHYNECLVVDGRAKEGAHVELGACRDAPQVSSIFASQPLVDVMGISEKDLPGLGAQPFSIMDVGDDYVSGRLLFGGTQSIAHVFKIGRAKVNALVIQPEDLTLDALIPSLDETLLDRSEAGTGLLTVILNGADAEDVQIRDLPAPLIPLFETATRDQKSIDFAPGLMWIGRLETNRSALGETMKFLEVRDTDLSARATLSPLLVTADHASPAGLSALLKKHEEAIAQQSSIRLDLTDLTLPSLEKVIAFERATLQVTTAAPPVLTGPMTVTLPRKEVEMAGSIQLLEDGRLQLGGTSEISWKKAFGLPFLELQDIGLRGTLDSQSGAAEIGLVSTAKLGRNEIESLARLVVGRSGVEDFSIGFEGEIALAELDGYKDIPGFREFSFQNFQIGLKASYGEISWDRLNLKGRAVVLNEGDSLVMMARVDGLQAGTLIPAAPEPFKSLRFGRSVLFLSSQDMDGTTLADLPEPAQAILAGIADQADEPLPIYEGVGVLASVSEDDIPAPMRKVMAEDLDVLGSLQGPLILSGTIDDFFSSIPNLTVAAKLPNYTLPKNQPLSQVINFDKVGTAFFVRMLTGTTAFQFGVRGNMDVDVPHLNNPRKVDTLSFNGELIASVDLVSVAGSVKAAGYMDGKWNSPFGLNENYTIEDPAIVIGVDTEGSVEFGVGGNTEIVTRGGRQRFQAEVDALVNINFSTTIPLPKKLGIRFAANELDMFTYTELADAGFRGVLSGPMAETVLSALPAPDRAVALNIQEEIRKADVSLETLLQLDKLPVPLFVFKDVELFFATPGAVIPGREDTMGTMGAVIAGKTEVKLQGATHKIGETENRLTLADGMLLRTELAGQDLGPITLNDTKLNFAASLNAVPAIQLQGGWDAFGKSTEVAVDIQPLLATVTSKQEYGSLLQFDLKAFAGTEGIETISDFAKADFYLDSSLKSDPKTWLETEGLNTVRAALNGIGSAIQDTEAELERAKAEVARLDGVVEEMRAVVRRERQAAADALRAAQSRVRDVQNRIRDVTGKRDSASDRVQRCNQSKRICVRWEPFKCRSRKRVPDLYKRARCEAKNAPRRLEVARWEAERLTLVASDKTAIAALRAVESGTNLLPVDADPRVAGPIAARDVAQLTLDAARLAAAGITQFNDILDPAIESIRLPDSFKLSNGTVRGSLRQAIEGKPVLLDLDFESFGQRYQERLAFSLTDPEFNARQLSTIALGIVTRRILQDTNRIGIVPHDAVAFVEDVYLSQRATVQTDIDAALAAHSEIEPIEIVAAESLAVTIGNERTTRLENQLTAEAQKQAERGNLVAARSSVLETVSKIFSESQQLMTIRARDEATKQLLCLEATTQENSRGASRIIFAECTGRTNQVFVLAKDGEVHGIDGQCLDYQEKDQLWLYDCNGHPGMRWEIRDSRLFNAHRDMCLRGVGSTIRRGTPAEIAKCDWRRSSYAFGDDHSPIYVTAKHPKKQETLCLRSTQERNSNGSIRMSFGTCEGGTDEMFLLRGDDMVTDMSGWCLDPQEREELWLHKCSGHPGMQFRLQGETLQNVSTKKCVVPRVISRPTEVTTSRTFGSFGGMIPRIRVVPPGEVVIAALENCDASSAKAQLGL